MARRAKTLAVIKPPSLPQKPPPTAREIEAEERIVQQLLQLNEHLKQRCLDRAVVLAQQAARRRGPLVEHFIEIGRRYGETLCTPEKPALRVVKGGAE